jgi:cyclopropane fatty-acyl-phospholipid synthase-like methyltransferase
MLAAGGHEHYFAVGKSALNVIQATLVLAGVNSPKTILDFGCGAGRVTRWLRAAFPDAKISACDTREEDLKFVRQLSARILGYPPRMSPLSRSQALSI